MLQSSNSQNIPSESKDNQICSIALSSHIAIQPIDQSHWVIKNLYILSLISSLEVMLEDEVHDQLDDLALRTLELMQDLIQAKHQLQQVMSQGYLMLAKARYSSNQHSVAITQLPAEITPSFVVKSEECLRAETEVRFNYLSVLTDADDKNTKEVKKRGKAGSKTKEKLTDETKKSEDPIRWFGLLTPLALKEAQSSFKRGCDLVVEVANLQNELEGVVARKKFLMRSLRKLKQGNENHT